MIWSLSFMIFFILLELIIPVRSLPFIKKGFWIDIIWYLFIQNFLLSILVFRFIDMLAPKMQLHLVSNLPLILQLVISILLIEFVAYWLHRLNHANWIMWRLHEVHHTSEELNVLSSSRIHFVELIVIRVISVALIAALGASIQTLFLFMIFDSFFALFIHSNVKVKIGPLKYIFNSPEMHHIHHMDKMELQNTNFGDKLAIWDWVFGTALILNSEEMEKEGFGIGYEYPQDLVGQSLYMFRKKEKETTEQLANNELEEA